MKKQLLVLLLLLPILGNAQERGIGIRLGDPFSLTYKDFVRDYISYELSLGSGSINTENYFKKSFARRPPSPSALLASVSAAKGISLAFRMAAHTDITDSFELEEGTLLGYVGLGAQLRTTQVSYLYGAIDNTMNPPKPFETDTRTNGDFGPEFFIGADYYFDSIPFAVFVETGIFFELIDRAHLKGQGGLGIRYLF